MDNSNFIRKLVRISSRCCYHTYDMRLFDMNIIKRIKAWLNEYINRSNEPKYLSGKTRKDNDTL